jgi:hypothetical protein
MQHPFDSRRSLAALLIALSIFAGSTRAHAQAPGTPAAQPAPSAQPPTLTGPLADDATGLFTPRWNMFQLAGRVSSISGDAARYQRYEDLRDGLLFTGARLQRVTPEFEATGTIDNLG